MNDTFSLVSSGQAGVDDATFARIAALHAVPGITARMHLLPPHG